MTKIKILGDRIIFDGHADTQRECETVTLMCDNLAKSIDFKTIKYENGYAEFEKIGGVKDLKDLMFPPAPSENITIIFDSHITKVVCESVDSPYGTPYGGGEWTTSGQTVNGIYDQNLTYTVTLESGYVIDTVTSSESTNLTIGADGLTFSGQVTAGNDATITITSKQGGASKQTIDVSTLSGWESLASGDHSITVKTKASDYLDSASSNAVTVSKAASGHSVVISGMAGNFGFNVYDGTSSSGTLLGNVLDTNSITVTCTSGNLYLYGDSNIYNGATTTGGVTKISDGSWSATFSVSGDGTITANFYCFVEGTLITLADGSTKPVEDIDYTDDILVWDFDNGVQSSAKPCWIAKPNVAPCYWEITLSDGTVLKLVGANGKSHRLFNSRGKFVYPQDFENSEQTVKQDGSTPYIVKCEKIYKEVKYYNFATDRALNNYANGVLCGCRFSNVYPIENMKYVKDDRTLATREEYKEIPDKLFYGLRLAEQQNLNDSPDNVNYYHTMKEHVIHNYIEHERDYTGNADYKT